MKHSWRNIGHSPNLYRHFSEESRYTPSILRLSHRYDANDIHSTLSSYHNSYEYLHFSIDTLLLCIVAGAFAILRYLECGAQMADRLE